MTTLSSDPAAGRCFEGWAFLVTGFNDGLEEKRAVLRALREGGATLVNAVPDQPQARRLPGWLAAAGWCRGSPCFTSELAHPSHFQLRCLTRKPPHPCMSLPSSICRLLGAGGSLQGRASWRCSRRSRQW